MIVKILASGSTGNSTLIKFEKINVLIDLGITNKKIKETISKVNLELDDIDYCFITHEHIDHIKGLPVFMKNSRAIVYLTRGTYNYLVNSDKYADTVDKYYSRFRLIEHKNYDYFDFDLGNVNIKPLKTFHDAGEPVGYRFTENEKMVCYLTDTGFVSKDTLDLIKNANCYIFETNHDPEILMNSDRPFVLKQRILGDNGHLSNADSFYYLSQILGEKTSVVFCAHISLECNLVDIIEFTKNKVLSKIGIDVSNVKFIYTKQSDIEEVVL